MHWTVQEAITTGPLLWLAGWLRWAGGTTLENRERPPCRHARHGSVVLESRGSRLILILGVRGGAEE